MFLAATGDQDGSRAGANGIEFDRHRPRRKGAGGGRAVDREEPAADLTHGTEMVQLLEDIGVDEAAFEQGGGGGNGTEAVDHDIGLGPGFEGA